MAFEFNVSLTPKGTPTATNITFNAVDPVTGSTSTTYEVQMIGTGLSWNNTTDVLTATTVTSLIYSNSGTALHTVTLDTSLASTFVADFNSFVSDSKTGIGTFFTAVVNAFGAFENWNPSNTSYGNASTVDVKVYNGGTQTGVYRLVGSSIDEFGQPSAATVSYIEVWNTAGTTKLGQIDPAVSGDTFNFAALQYGWGMKPDALSMYLMRGDDTVTVAATNTFAVDAGTGSDTITHAGTGVTDTISYASAEGAVDVTLADPVSGVTHGTATGGGGDDTLTGFEYITGSRYGEDSLHGNNQANYLDGGIDKLHDTLVGGAGDDTYYLRDGDFDLDTQDSVSELVGGGTDLVISDTNRDLNNVSFQVENLTLKAGSVGTDAYGNSLANVITGNANANYLDGRGGADTLVGGAGDDTYIVETYVVNGSGVVTSRDSIVETSGNGTDTVRVKDSYALESTADIEILETFDATQMDNFSLTGSSIINEIRGNAGANRIDGGGTDGVVDVLKGGRGNDTYVLYNENDTISEVAETTAGAVSQGVDTIESTISRSLASYSNIENITLTGTANVNATGSATQTGQQANNKLVGNTGNNRLEGLVGNDTYTGDLGNDQFVWDGSGSDKVTDYKFVVGNADWIDVSKLGIMDFDTLKTLGSTTTALDGTKTTVFKYQSNGVFHNLTVVGMDFEAIKTAVAGGALASTYFIFDTSTAGTTKYGYNGKNDYIFGGDGNDTLNGFAASGTDTSSTDYLYGEAGDDTLDGGLGADQMYGGAGNDTYIVDNGGDAIKGETSTSGTDTVQTKLASYSLATTANTYIENLSVHSSVATGTTVTLIGNDSANTLTGHSGIDIMKAGKGIDTMNGGDGSDVYYVDHASDAITGEASGLGDIDKVMTTISFTLGSGDDIEYLAATTGFTSAGVAVTTTTNMNLTGNTLDQTIVGNAGINYIDGKGGNDTLTGGGGKDYFDFTTAPATSTNKDTITDFNAFYDTIRLENTGIFTALGAGTGVLASNKFYVGAAAHDLDDRIIYNKVTGVLSYDADGSGSGAAIQFAYLKTKPTLTNADIVVI